MKRGFLTFVIGRGHNRHSMNFLACEQALIPRGESLLDELPHSTTVRIQRLGNYPLRNIVVMDVDQGDQAVSQVFNSLNVLVWQVDDFKRFHRFLILGSELPTYHAGQQTLGRENASAILRLIESGRGVEVVEEIVKFSVDGRTAKQGPIMFSLAMCARLGDLKTKRKAYEVLSQVCRIPTHLFMFVDCCKKLSAPTTGWGRAHRKAIIKWYTSKEPLKLAMDVTKYQKREGWSHTDIARLTHIKPEGDELKCLISYVVRGWEITKTNYLTSGMNQNVNTTLWFLNQVEEMKTLTAENVGRIVELITEHKLVREHIPTQCLSLREVHIRSFT